jgi:hypothetical protein
MASHPDQLYDEDFFAWTQFQAKELAQVRAVHLVDAVAEGAEVVGRNPARTALLRRVGADSRP